MIQPPSSPKAPAEIPASDARENTPTTQDVCCTGIDMPGVGYKHAGDCPVSPGAVLRFPVDQQALEVADAPPSLRRMLNDEPPVDLLSRDHDRTDDPLARKAMREMLLAQLIFAARNLAEKNILGKDWGSIPAGAHAATWCRECQMTEHLGQVHHAQTCWTGRVLSLIVALCEQAAKQQKRKENAPTEESVETGSATDRKPSQGDLKEPWSYEFDDEFGGFEINDRSGHSLVVVLKADNEREIVSRIVDCVNSMAGVDLLAKGGQR